jgi:hypothetical protein
VFALIDTEPASGGGGEGLGGLLYPSPTHTHSLTVSVTIKQRRQSIGRQIPPWLVSMKELSLCISSLFGYYLKDESNFLCTYDLYSPVHNVLDACISITRASGRALRPVKWHRDQRRVPYGAHNLENSRAQPSPTCPSNGYARI